MSSAGAEKRPPRDRRALVAVDLGAESCRVSLLRWNDERPSVELVHRFQNGPRLTAGHLYWDLRAIQAGVETGLRRAANQASEGIAAIAIDGWAVDYVRLSANGELLGEPFCYRDERTISAESALHQRLSAARMRELTGVQLLRINTVYQQFADRQMRLPEGERWLNLPEYLLYRWGGEPVAEYTNASHTQMVSLGQMEWCEPIFAAAELSLQCAAPIVPAGTVLGTLQSPLADLPALRDTLLIAPACHDTASAISGIPASGEGWAYISSGTWSLVGTSLPGPRNDPQAAGHNFTNLAGAGGRVCFHQNVNGLWLLRQCMDAWHAAGGTWEIGELIAAAERVGAPDTCLETDDPELWLAGDMPGRINSQRIKRASPMLDESPAGAPVLANLIFHSLAARYAEVLCQIEAVCNSSLDRLFIVGGGSQNRLLNRLTAEATRRNVLCGSPESSTIGNFAIQLAVLEGARNARAGAESDRISHWARLLFAASHPHLARV